MKPTIPEVIDRFRAYYKLNPAWGSLHVVLDDGNIDDATVRWCRDWAIEHSDPEGAALAEILLRMSKTQRSKIGDKAGRKDEAEREISSQG